MFSLSNILVVLTSVIGLTIAGGVQVSTEDGRQTCTITAMGSEVDDVPNILQAFSTCGNNGKVVFPEGETYWIATRLNPILNNVEIEWRGEWLFSDNLTYWRNNSYPIWFQNHHAGFILTGDGIYINGYGTGGINGNGDIWYTVEAGDTQPGRPMPFVFWNVSDVVVSNFYVHQPQLWSLNIMNGTDMYFSDITCNATATKAPYGTNWVQNTDGFDTMDATNIYLENFYYQGGDDCIALKPQTYNFEARNVTCHGGNGIAIGSLGQYLQDSSVANVVVDHVHIIRYNDDMENGAYIKTWVGVLVPQTSYESAGLPRGGGWGSVRDVLFSNFLLEGPSMATSINQDSGDNGSFPGSSLMEISNIAFVNFTGYTVPSSSSVLEVNDISCSTVHPCFDIEYENFTVTPGTNGSVADAQTDCQYVATNGVTGENCTSR